MGDMEVPDFSYYRRPSTKDSSAKNQENSDSRMGFSYLMSGALGVSGAYAATSTVNQLLGSCLHRQMCWPWQRLKLISLMSQKANLWFSSGVVNRCLYATGQTRKLQENRLLT